MGAGDLWKALTLVGTVAVVAVLTTAIWIVGDKEAIEEFFGDWPLVPDGLAAPHAETSGEGHERGSAACEAIARSHVEGQ